MSLQALQSKKDKLLLKRQKINEQIREVDSQIEAEENAQLRAILKKSNLSVDEAGKLLQQKQEEKINEY